MLGYGNEDMFGHRTHYLKRLVKRGADGPPGGVPGPGPTINLPPLHQPGFDNEDNGPPGSSRGIVQRFSRNPVIPFSKKLCCNCSVFYSCTQPNYYKSYREVAL